MRQRILRLLPIAAAAVVTACMMTMGQRPERNPLAHEPRGLTATLDVHGGGTLVGELLEVQDTAYLVMTPRELVLVPYRQLRSARFEQMPRYAISSPAPDGESRRQLRLRSRYPQGVNPDVMAKLLALTGQSSPTVVGR